MIKVYSTGAELVTENKEFLNGNPYMSLFFFLDGKVLHTTDTMNYAVRAQDAGRTLLAMKVEPYSLLLYGDENMAEELFIFLMTNGYDINSLLGSEIVCDRVCDIMKDQYGIDYYEALAMDFMEAGQITEPSCGEIEVPVPEDVPELIECTKCFIQDCGLQDPVSAEKIIRELPNFRILRRDGKIASMAKISPATNDALKIVDVYTRPEYRGRGIARLVVNTVKNEILLQGKIATLNVDKKNPISNHLYRSLGFEKVFSQGEYRRRDQ